MVNSSDASISITLSTRTLFMSNFTVINTRDFRKDQQQFFFPGGALTSSPYRVLHSEIMAFDMVSIKLTVHCGFSQIDCFLFRWEFEEPRSRKFSKAARILTSILIGQLTFWYFTRSSFRPGSFVDVFCVVLGITGVFASNPLSVFFAPILAFEYAEHALLALYVSIWRLFCLCQFELIRNRQPSVNICFILFFTLFFCCYGSLEGWANFERGRLTEADETIVMVDSLLMVFHFAYATISLLWLFLAWVWLTEPLRNRFVFYTALVVLGISITTLSQIYCVKTQFLKDRIVPSLMYALVHMSSGAVVPMLMRSNESR
jgi:hypothetical protein